MRFHQAFYSDTGDPSQRVARQDQNRETERSEQLNHKGNATGSRWIDRLFDLLTKPPLQFSLYAKCEKPKSFSY